MGRPGPAIRLANVAQPLWHTLASVIPAMVAGERHGAMAASALLAGAIAVDSDHLVDWALNGGREDYTRRIVVPAHGWDLVAACVIASRTTAVPAPFRPLALAFAAGLACHLTLDHMVNRPETLLGYVFTWRVWNGFDRLRCGWLPATEWTRHYRTSQRAAPTETLVATLVGLAILIVGRERRP